MRFKFFKMRHAMSDNKNNYKSSCYKFILINLYNIEFKFSG